VAAARLARSVWEVRDRGGVRVVDVLGWWLAEGVGGFGWLAGCRVGGGEGDVVAEGFELVDCGAGFAGCVGVLGVVVGAEVVVAVGGVGEEVSDGDEDGTGGGDDGFEFAAAFSDASVAFAEEGFCSGGGGGRDAEGAFEVGVAFAGFAGSGFGP
jgi:hypothetical protein